MTWYVQLHASCFDPYQGDSQIVTRKDSDLWFYRVFIYLSGVHLPYLTCATYHLPAYFGQQADHHVRRTVDNPSCRFEVWSWSEFDVRACIRSINGDHFQWSCHAGFGEQVKANPDKIKILASAGR